MRFVSVRGLIFQMESRPNLWPAGETTLQFEVNGQIFFVNFVPEEGRWYCYAPTPDGVQRIPVATDTAPFETFPAPEEIGNGRVVH